MRNTMDALAKLTGFPSNAHVKKININNMPAEWICTDDAPAYRQAGVSLIGYGHVFVFVRNR